MAFATSPFGRELRIPNLLQEAHDSYDIRKESQIFGTIRYSNSLLCIKKIDYFSLKYALTMTRKWTE